ncbi:MAG: tetratricopeptide repeat protein, partial [gamma proteobacterium symbiont of Ctena orbiculata]
MSNLLINAEKKLRKGKLSEAYKLIERALKKDPRNPELQYLIGETLLLQGHVDHALDYLKQAVSSGRAKPCWYVICGMALEQKGLFEDAEKSYKMAEMSGCDD